MRHTLSRTALVVVSLLAISRGASAQTRTLPSSETPRAEVGIYGGLWNLEASGPIGLGGRVAINRSEWFATEVSVERKRADDYGPDQSALIVNARLMTTDPDRRAFCFVTAGAAVGKSDRQSLSPMFGGGIQTLWTGGIVAMRGELQYFPSGLTRVSTRTRVTVSIAFAIR